MFSFLYPKNKFTIKIEFNEKIYPVEVKTNNSYQSSKEKKNIPSTKVINTKFSTKLINLAYARSGDKGDHANIGVIARKSHYFPFINNALDSESISKYFSPTLKGPISKWIVPGINGINFLLKNSLGGGGMASLSIDPQGKAYAQMLLEYSIPVSSQIIEEIKIK